MKAVVIGGGLAGTLAAAALAHHGQVTIVEPDELADQPTARPGTPQARHAHLLWSGGARHIETLLPGTHERWLTAGAHRLGLPDQLVSLLAPGWLPRIAEQQYLISASRDLIDWGIRHQALRNPQITLRSGVRVVGLLGHARQIHGVRIADRAGGASSELPADFVIDATGRGSRARQWLTACGLAPAEEQVVDSGLAYATRIFRMPDAVPTDFPIVNVQADPSQPGPGQTSIVVPLENRRWLVTLSGTRGGHPPADDEQFVKFAQSVRHPIVGDLIAAAEPISPVYRSHSTINRRYRYERLPTWPAGFLVIGDAVATYNPIYGQGMSVAAHHAVALHQALAHRGPDPAITAKLQRRIARIVTSAWSMATSQDLRYPDAIGSQPGRAERLLQGYVDRLMRTALVQPTATRALIDTFTLSAPMTRLLSPAVVLRTLRGPTTPAPRDPPFTTAELDVLRRILPANPTDVQPTQA